MRTSEVCRSSAGNLGAALLPALLCLSSCSNDQPPAVPVEATPRTVFVQLFEWPWPAIASECEDFLGPAGYAGVQVSPPNEHVPGPEWWTRYQPVSYRLESRGGTRQQFADMVGRCKAAGVDIYGDAVINHMARVGHGSGVAASEYGEYTYPVPYDYDDFHHCGRNGDDAIRNYQDLWEVQNCELAKLADLDTGNAEVQARIASYLNDLLSLGVAGFRIDAAKHIAADELGAILSRLNSTPHIYQEVIDRGGEPIDAHDYLGNGLVSEFKYAMAIFDAFSGARLDSLAGLAARPGFLPADKAVVFVDNHDIQRGHAGAGQVLNYKRGKLYELANIFMLAWPYGQPMVMSSYRFADGDQGPPATAPIDPDSAACAAAWVCEHRMTAIAAMVEFRNVTAGHAVGHWQAPNPTTIAFGRGDRGFVAINIGADPVHANFATGMSKGRYCNVVAGCTGDMLGIAGDGSLAIEIPGMSAIAVHAGRRSD